MNPQSDREAVRDWFQKHRNACRCTGYNQLVDAVHGRGQGGARRKDRGYLAYKLPADGQIWGTKYPRPSALAKVTGTLDYGADLALKLPPDALHLALVQADVSHANIKSIDASEAEAMPGVVKVVTHKDVKGKNRITGLITFPTNLGDGWDRPILCDEKVFQYGDAIAIVCADTEKAKAAAAKVKVDLEKLPAYMSAPAAMAEDAMEIHPGTPNIYFTQKIAKGEDTGPIFDKADGGGGRRLLRGPPAPHAHGAGRGLRLPGCGRQPAHTFQIHRPAPARRHDRAGAGGGIGKSGHGAEPGRRHLRLQVQPHHGGPGGRGLPGHRQTGFLRYDYQQQMTYTGKRSPFFVKMRMAADKDGKLLGMETDWSVDHGPYSEFGDLLTLRGAQFMGAGYDIPNIRGEGRTVCTNHAWGSAFRAYGSPQSEFSSEVLMDELAEKLNMDPLELRYKNAYREGSTTPTGQTPEVLSVPEMLDILRPKYKEALDKAKANSDDMVKRGVGISIGVYGCGLDGPDASETQVELNPDNTVTVYACWQDHGQGADMGALGTAHEALRPLGIAPEQIRLVLNDTALAPNSGPSGGSRQQVVTGRAIQNGCEQLLEAMEKSGGGYRTYDEMTAENIPTKYDGKWAAPATACDENGQGSPFSVYMYGVFMSEVAVELATGNVTVEKMTLVADIGKVNNRLVTDGQLYGGIAQGIGLALSEDFEDIKKHSTLVGAGFPYAKVIPDDIELIYVETPRPEGPFGAAGVGELPLTSPHAAIINAIYNACGARITKLPAKPEKVLAALKG
jgi:aldehyde oxidoreductase